MGNILSGQVVFNQSLINTYLAMAAQEKLIVEDDRHKTDKFLYPFLSMTPSPVMQRLVLEQVVLTPTILTIGYVPTGQLSGPIIEQGLLKVVPKPEVETNRIYKISSDILTALLEAEGYIISIDEIFSRIEDAQKALQEADNFQELNGEELPNPISVFTRAAIRDPYPQHIVQVVQRHQAIFDRAKPIFDVVTEFNELSNVSDDLNVLMRVPTSYNLNHTMITNEIGDDEDIALVRIASTKMGKLTYRDTLKESLKLAEHENTTAFRQQLARWASCLNDNDLDVIDVIQRDVEYASKQMQEMNVIDTINRIVTYLSIPVAIAEAVITSMPPTLGLTLTVVGLTSTLATDIAKRNYRWAMFGQV